MHIRKAPYKRNIIALVTQESRSSKDDIELSTFAANNKHSVANDNAFPAIDDDVNNDSVANDNAFPALSNDVNTDIAADDSKMALLSNGRDVASKTSPSSPFDDDDDDDDDNGNDDVTHANEPLLATSTFKPAAKQEEQNKSTEVVWDDYDRDNNPFFES